MSKILLETVSLKKSYLHVNGPLTLFQNFSFKIKEGEFCKYNEFLFLFCEFY